ncbi:MAG: ArgE/DapE family deacylase [Ardenticatenaceae bacterium]|nr:ArgE/DapE family deacylase [Ardenticatenaceae bacterium]
MLDHREQKALAAVDFDGLLSFLDELVAVPSLDGSPEEITVQEMVAAKLTKIGLAVDSWEIDFETLQKHPSYSAEVERPRGIGVVGQMGAGQGASLILNGHTDVVPAGVLDNWTVDPWRATVNLTEGRVYGRGALDMKGGLCCALFAAKAIQDAGLQLLGNLYIQSVIGEEDGGCGTLAAVTRGYRADAAIVLEPTELKIAPAQAGALNFRVTIPGRAAHGAIRYEGVDPLEKFLLIYQSILAYEQARNQDIDHPLFKMYPIPYPICVGTIHGGVWASTVAESLTFEGRLGIGIDENVSEARRAFEGLIERVSAADEWLREHPPTVEWWGGQFAPAKISSGHPIVLTVQEAFTETTGHTTGIQGMPYGADMRHLVNDGQTPTILFGPGDVRRAHQPNEFVPLEDLETVTKTLVLTIMRFCGIVHHDPPVAETDTFL